MSGLLDGLKVLDLSLWHPGHYATQLLADLGADVLKVEPPGGDRMRILPDRFNNYNGHKRSIVLDFKRKQELAQMFELVVETEVVVEGYRPGVAERLGVGYDSLSSINPALVYCSISGFGQTGPLSHATGHDYNYQAYAGSFATPEGGGTPVTSGALLADQSSGMGAAFAILAAVLCARRTGEGEYIDFSMADLLATWVAPKGRISDKNYNPDKPEQAPGTGTYATADGRYVVLGIFSEDHFWDLLCQNLGFERYVGLSMAERNARSTELRSALEGAFLKRNQSEVVAELDALSVPIAPILNWAEAMAHPHFWARGCFSTWTRRRTPSGSPYSV